MVKDTELFIKQHKYYPHLSGVTSRYFRQAQRMVIRQGLYEDYLQHQALCLCGVDEYIKAHRLYTKPHRLNKEIWGYLDRELKDFLYRSGFRRTRSSVEAKAYWYYSEIPTGDLHNLVY